MFNFIKICDVLQCLLIVQNMSMFYGPIKLLHLQHHYYCEMATANLLAITDKLPRECLESYSHYCKINKQTENKMMLVQ